MAKGLPRSIIAKFGITKKAWQEYRKQKGAPKGSLRWGMTRSKVKKVASVISEPIRMAKRRSRRASAKGYARRAMGLKIPISIAVPLIGSFFTRPHEGWNTIYDNLRGGNYPDALKCAVNGWTGFDTSTGKFAWLPAFAIQTLGGVLVHKVIGGFLGVNKVLARNRIPIIRI